MSDSKKNIFIIFFFLIFLFLLYVTFSLFKPFFNVIAWAVILTLVFFPLQMWLTKLFKGKKTLASLIITLLAVIIVIIPCILFMITLIKQGIEFYQTASEYLQSEKFNRLLSHYQDQEQLHHLEQKLAPLGISLTNVKDFALKMINGMGNFLFNQTRIMVINVFYFFISIFFTIFIFFFLLRDGDQFFVQLKEIVPLKTEDKDSVFKTLYQTTRGVVLSMSVGALIQGVFLFIGYSIVGVPYIIFWTILSMFLAFLPIIGPGVIYVPIAVYAFFNIGVGKSIFILIYGIILGNVVDNLVRPYLISESVKIHILLLFLSVLGGLHVFGFIGIFLGPLALATCLAFVKIYRKEFVLTRNSHPTSTTKA